jgi:hypothetical protein
LIVEGKFNAKALTCQDIYRRFLGPDDGFDLAIGMAEYKGGTKPIQQNAQAMKYLVPILLILAAFTVVPAQKPDRTEAELMQIERDIGQANIRRDKPYFERIEADEFIFTDSGGGLTTKAEDVASLDKPAGDFKLVAYDVDEMKVKVYGKTAVVWGRATSTYKSKDKEMVSRTRFTDVFVKRDGRWQIVAGHSSRIPNPKQ